MALILLTTSVYYYACSRGELLTLDLGGCRLSRSGVLCRGESMSPGNIVARKKSTKPSGGDGQPIGLDIGTANIVVYVDDQPDSGARMEANAFFTVPSMPNTRQIL